MAVESCNLVVGDKIKLRPPRMALLPKKTRLVPLITPRAVNAKDGLREHLRKRPKSAGS
jgi:hypothetical protein